MNSEQELNHYSAMSEQRYEPEELECAARSPDAPIFSSWVGQVPTSATTCSSNQP